MEFQTTQHVVIGPISPNNHTMRPDHFLTYVKTRFSEEQRSLIKRYAIDVNDFMIVGVPTNQQIDWLERSGYQVLATAERASRSNKKFNNLRPTLRVIEKDRQTVLAAFCFPSKEYIFHIGEAFCTYLSQTTKKEVRVKAFFLEEYTDLASAVGFDEISQHLIPGDFLVFGEVELIVDELKSLGFEVPSFEGFGLSNIFCATRITNPVNGRTALVVASRETYWGTALSQYVKKALELGARKIVYCAKAGRYENEDFAHTIFIPKSFYAVSKSSENGSETGSNIETPKSLFGTNGPLRNLGAPYHAGVHVSVPTVVGETHEQEEKYKRARPATIDNEISYLASIVARYNELHDAEATLDCFHFITDILTPGSNSSSRVAPPVQLADKNEDNPNLRLKKGSAFKQISSILSEAINQFGVRRLSDGNLIKRILTDPEYRKTLRDSVHSEVVSSHRVAAALCAYIPYYMFMGSIPTAKAINGAIKNRGKPTGELAEEKFEGLQTSNSILGLSIEFMGLVHSLEELLGNKKQIHEVQIETAEKLYDKILQTRKEFQVIKFHNSSAGGALNAQSQLFVRQFITYAILHGHLLHYLGQLSLALNKQPNFTKHRREKYRLTMLADNACDCVDGDFDQKVYRTHLFRVVLGWFNHDDRASKVGWKVERRKEIDSKLERNLKDLVNLRSEYQNSGKIIAQFLDYEHAFMLCSLSDYNPSVYEEDARVEVQRLVKQEVMSHMAYDALIRQGRRRLIAYS